MAKPWAKGSARQYGSIETEDCRPSVADRISGGGSKRQGPEPLERSSDQDRSVVAPVLWTLDCKRAGGTMDSVGGYEIFQLIDGPVNNENERRRR